ncbi:thiamine-phosphate kinase, partial [Pseudomonas putida]|nr:thiamine-phosphate kinase [Pseudomonas putida]
GGDHYVLAFTLPPEALAPLAGLGCIEVHIIGRVLEGQGVTLRDSQGQDITPVQRGYQHFRERP